MKNIKAFTMAEILISLTIIGIIAAITLPVLVGSINEKAWANQRKALYSRMTQAISLMPSLNSYGNFIGEWADCVVTPTKDTAAERFVTDGLAKVLKINNICSIPVSTTDSADRHKELAKCGIHDKLTNMENSKIPFPTKLSELNSAFTGVNNPQHHIDTSAAAFETSNGESLAVFYNPYCMSDSGSTGWHFSQPVMCANFIYDLNSKKGPNKVGKDIGFITVLYPIDSEVVAPMPLHINAKNISDGGWQMPQTMAAAACRVQDKNSRVPNRDELAALWYNFALFGIERGATSYYWSNSLVSEDYAWIVGRNNGAWEKHERITYFQVRCVER